MSNDKLTPVEAARNYATNGSEKLFHTRVAAFLVGDSNGYARGKAEREIEEWQKGMDDLETRVGTGVALAILARAYERGKAEGDSNGYQRGKAEAEKRIWEAIAAWTGDPEMPVPLGQLTQEVKQIIFGGGDE